jgi:hypothetical protein
MRISVSSKHKYPAGTGGIGGGRVFDCLVKGLTELGHAADDRRGCRPEASQLSIGGCHG